MLNVLISEFAKLRRSLVLLLCAAAPVLVALLIALMFHQKEGPDQPWSFYLVGASAIWGFFMLPMAVTALTILVAQLEHGPRFWNHLLALPVPRASFFAAKIAAVVLLVAAMTLALFALVPELGWLADTTQPARSLTGEVDLAQFGSILARMFGGALLLVTVQLWAALRFRSFVPPLVLGIGGTFVAVVATGSSWGPYFPWLIPTNQLASDPANAQLALTVGIVGGLVVAAAMLVDLSRREIV
ncbi:MAG TPA: ABC transporter permease [Allosphingosinicella sp.]|jgi:ABC-2 type transport system permease protein|nr:ABC transporter permease [Allosphingosinicella sp.]